MTDRPIVFSPPMARALLAGTKTQTRRKLRNPEYYGCPTGDCPHNKQAECNEYMNSLISKEIGYAVGDRLWVKETWRTSKIADELKPSQLVGGGYSRIWYEDDGRDNCDQHGKTRVPIFMPRWASRLTLTITDVRVEQLQDISADDCRAEGHPIWPEISKNQVVHDEAARDWYIDLWDSINGPGAWEQNSWVVVISFDVEQRNINQ